MFLLDVLWRQEAFTPKWGWNVGELWFLQLLLVFSTAYALFTRLWPRSEPIAAVWIPRRRDLWLAIAVLTALTFVVRIWFPIGHFILGFPLAHLVHYVAAFCLGSLAYRGDWLEHLSATAGRYWGRVTVGTLPFLSILALATGVLNDRTATGALLGAPTLVAFGFAAWESVLMISIACWMLCTFNAKYNRTSNILQWLSGTAYTVYIVHQTVLIALHILLHDNPAASTLKFFIVAGIAISLCFGTSDVLRRIPWTRRVLG